MAIKFDLFENPVKEGVSAPKLDTQEMYRLSSRCGSRHHGPER